MQWFFSVWFCLSEDMHIITDEAAFEDWFEREDPYHVLCRFKANVITLEKCKVFY